MVATASELGKVISDLIQVLQREIRVEAAILYGSYAHGNPREGSDIDIAIISPDFEGLRMPERQRIISHATLHCDSRLEPIGFSSSEYRSPGRHSFLREILRTGRVVYQAPVE